MATMRYLVTDVARGVAFYRDLLGFEEELEMLPAFAMVRRGDLDLWLAGPASSAARPMPDGGRRCRAAGTGSSSRSTTSTPWSRACARGARSATTSSSGPGGKQIHHRRPGRQPVELFEARE